MLRYKNIYFVWNVVVTLFIHVLVTAHATELPSYIHPCGRKDPNYDQCVLDNINSLKSKICTGMPEFNIPPIDIIAVDKITVFDTDNLKLFWKDVKLTGFCEVSINFVRADPDKLHFNISAVLKNLRMDCLYDFDIRILLSIAHSGSSTITLDEVGLEINMDLKVATKNSEKQIYASKVNTNVNVIKFEYKINNIGNESAQVLQILNEFVNNNKQVLLNNVVSVLEKEISKKIIFTFNSITHSNYEKLFPEKA
ncbi:uncharacterized protein LOC105423222 [Pogonomyrmex barbatus]|uniref:Uncharacterized protein LOC105423222 n=1 Tax=Pogonomyrmex barbatus TaxID=144034 RepID=A0A6I9VW83_9HYME|nr:uncharacterized protein LOC105423222 [Pogonomyrmex barbatus]